MNSTEYIKVKYDKDLTLGDVISNFCVQNGLSIKSFTEYTGFNKRMVFNFKANRFPHKLQTLTKSRILRLVLDASAQELETILKNSYNQ